MKTKNRIAQAILATTVTATFLFSGFGVSAWADDQDLKLSGCEGKMVLWDGYDFDNVTLTVSGDAAGTVKSEDINWSIADGGESIATITPAEDGLHAVLKGIGVGTTELVVTVNGVGTVTAPVNVGRMQPGSFGFTDGLTYTYTGGEIKPGFEVFSEAGDYPLAEGRDYVLTFENNVNCGIAKAKLNTVEEPGEPDHFKTAVNEFMITPAKAAIDNVKADKTSLTINAKDQKDTGISGYKVNYRKAGSEEWQEKTFAADSPALTIDGLDVGTHYEVRVCGYVDVPEDAYIALWLESQYSGEFSEVVSSATLTESGEEPSTSAAADEKEKPSDTADKGEEKKEQGKDAKASSSSKVSNEESPDTGDKNYMSAYIVAAGFSAGVIVIAVVYWKRMRKE